MTSDLVYAERDGEPLLARIHHPSGPVDGSAWPIVIDVHGGSWGSGDRTWGQMYAGHLAAAGYLVVSIDFRQGPRHRHPAASEDIAAAVRWTRASASSLGGDETRLALIGSSSGGHLALYAVVGPDAVTDVACVGAFWPPVDPLSRFRFARHQAASNPDAALRQLYERLCASSIGYFGHEATMGEASVPALVRDRGGDALPPLWIARAGRDTNVPAEMLDDLRDAWLDAGGAVEISDFPDAPHAFAHRPGPSTDRFLAELTAFLDANLAG